MVLIDKACFQHNMTYGKYKDFTKRRKIEKVLKDKAFKITSNPKYDGYQRGLASMVYKFFEKKSTGSGIKCQINYSQMGFINQLLKKPKRRKVYSLFKDNIWGVDLADMQLSSKYNKRIKILLCVIDIFNKYAWVAPLKDKNIETVLLEDVLLIGLKFLQLKKNTVP